MQMFRGKFRKSSREVPGNVPAVLFLKFACNCARRQFPRWNCSDLRPQEHWNIYSYRGVKLEELENAIHSMRL